MRVWKLSVHAVGSTVLFCFIVNFQSKAVNEKVQALEKSMGTIVRALKELKTGMIELQEQRKKDHNEEIEEILKNKKVVEDILESHTEAIKRIEKEIVKMENLKNKNDKVQSEAAANDDVEKEERSMFNKRKCRYFDKGFCKFRVKCRYIHPKRICEDYLRNGKCEVPGCKERHPEMCRYWGSGKCRRNENCDFLHATLENVDEDKSSTFKCVGCQNVWTDNTCVVKHNVNGRETFFCLNCQDWIKFKTRVHDKNWTLFDEAGNLRVDV